MKVIKIKVLKNPKGNLFSYGGHDVEISCDGKTVKAFVNSKNFVSYMGDIPIETLFGDLPHSKSYIENLKSSIQLAFRGWSPEQDSLTIELPK